MQAFDAAVGGQRKGEDSPSMSKNRASVQAPEPPLAESRSGSRPSLGSRASSVGSWRPSVFDFRSGGTCPTCRGTGRIPQGEGEGGRARGESYSDKLHVSWPYPLYTVRASFYL